MSTLPLVEMIEYQFPDSTFVRSAARSTIGSKNYPESLPYTAGVSLPADLDTAWRYAATTGSAGNSAATVRDKLDPE